MKQFFLGVLVAVGLTIVYHAFAQPKISVKVTPATTEERNDQIEIDGAYDNLDGTSTIMINACGTKIQATVQNKAMLKRDPEILRALQGAVDKACEGAEYTKSK